MSAISLICCIPDNYRDKISRFFSSLTYASDKDRKHILSRDPFQENRILLSIEHDSDVTDHYTQKSVTCSKDIISLMEIFSGHDRCVNSITDVSKENIFMTIPILRDLITVDSTYRFCRGKSAYKEYINQYTKMKGISDHIENLCDLSRETSIPISSISSSLSTRSDELDQSFMYSQLLKEIFLDMPADINEKWDFINYCYDKYNENKSQLELIKEFEEKYNNQSSIWWYTRPCFIFEVLNHALRTQELCIILKMGFFLRDLHHQIERVHMEMVNHNGFVVFRGQGMLHEEFDKVKNNKGGLLSFNHFLSTTLDAQVAQMFAESSRNDPNLVGLIFRIEITSNNSSASFAPVNQFSYLKSEEEVLFSMNAVFRIGESKQVDERLWEMNLILTNDKDPLLVDLTKYMLQKIKGPTSTHRMAQLMTQMGQYDKAEEIFNKLIRITPVNDERMIANLNHQLGFIKNEKGEWHEALSYHAKALKFQQKCNPSNDFELSAVFSNIGLVQNITGDYSEALINYNKALEIQKKFLAYNYPDPRIALTYDNIASVFYTMGQYTKALEYSENAVNIMRQKSTLTINPDLAVFYNNIGCIYQSLGSYSQSLSYYQRALEIQQKSLSLNHPTVAITLNNIASMYISMGDNPNAILNNQKALDIQQKAFSLDHFDLAITYNNIGLIYQSSKDHSKALANYKKSLEIKEKSLPHDHPSLGVIYNNIGSSHNALSQHSTALIYFEKALAIEQKHFPVHHPDVAITYNNIGESYLSAKNSSQALIYFEKALEINERSNLTNHPNMTTFYNNIGSAHYLLHDYSKALVYFQKQYDIQRMFHSNDHLLLASIHDKFGLVYEKLEEYSKALFHYQKVLQIKERLLPVDHPFFIGAYDKIGYICYLMDLYSLARSYYEKKLEIQLKSYQNNDPNCDLIATYNMIGFMYQLMKLIPMAVLYYKEAKRIEEGYSPSNHLLLDSN
ncbi:unnamed protein product [Adineta ricciae]|uniref:NAD(P)(+)--arginine ADP-ribosyltransferase n=1 Tax=Adineta ricciae TaxID=249248 RepID=A0A815MSG8_ADIRI|nr:unnamed protein product [Adineta ricciae]CAF1424584.1 unnamed protein product [Adineta ricciae]